jgi:hypothetical protein
MKTNGQRKVCIKLKELNKQYSNEYETIEHLEEDTTVIMINADSFIILDF